MSFVGKGEKTKHNMAKKAGAGADKAPAKDSFGKKGEKDMRNMAKPSKDKRATPVSDDAGSAEGYQDEGTASKSEYDPASGKRAKSVADLRNAQKLITERSSAGEASPTGSEGGQQDKHGSSKNATGMMKGGMGEMDKKSMKKPRGLADQMAGADEMEDPSDQDEEDSEQTKEGMTPKGKSRRKAASLKDIKRMIKTQMDV